MENKFLLKTHKQISIKHFEDAKAFIEFSDNIEDVYPNISE